MDHLWSPWRYQYVSSAGVVPLGKDYCLFCRVAAGTHEDAANLVVGRAERCFILLNRYPYASGHLMIAPYGHVATLEEADIATLEEMMRLARRCETALREVYQPDGLNFGFNIGQAAGAGIAGHIHMHGLPRWSGDTSFITTVAETRVLPEDLETTCRKLKAALQSPAPQHGSAGGKLTAGVALNAMAPPHAVPDSVSTEEVSNEEVSNLGEEESTSTPPRVSGSEVSGPAPHSAAGPGVGERDDRAIDSP